MLGARDPVTRHPKRVLIAGVSGVGKSTLARRVGGRLGLAYTEIDGLYHGPNWQPRETFVADVDQFTSAESWVTEWQYSAARELLADRADTLVWLDLPAFTAYRRIIVRTVRRSRTKEELWNGNREPGFWHALTHRDGIIRWAFATRRNYPGQMAELTRTNPKLVIVRLRSGRQVDRWFEQL